MEFSLADRTASLSVGEFAEFAPGPRSGAGGAAGLWRAQLGTHWHRELRARTAAENSAATFEIPIAGRIVHRGWTLQLAGRIDQLVPGAGGGALLREIKTVTSPLPVSEEELRAEHAGYFIQLAAYAALWRDASGAAAARGELLFIEAGSGLAQPVALAPADDALFRAQLDRFTEFLEHRRLARERLRTLRFRPAFAEFRPGQGEAIAALGARFAGPAARIFFEAPTGFGKTGALLEAALGRLRDGACDRVLYLTGKATGQLQVVRTLAAMAAIGLPVSSGETTRDVRQLLVDKAEPLSAEKNPAAGAPAGLGIASWLVRPKSEHCVNTVFHCMRDTCSFLADADRRWPQSGLGRFYLTPGHPHDLAALRAAGRDTHLCPYEITRAALAFQEVWIGDYNYVFSPHNRALFFEQPGFDPARTLLIIDEAHNLPARAADALSHLVRADDAREVFAELDRQDAPAPLMLAWENWTRLLALLAPADSLDPDTEDSLAEALNRLAPLLAASPPDYAALGPRCSELLWRTPDLAEWMGNAALKKLLWCPRAGELALTCLDAADATGETLRDFGSVVFASATLGPPELFAEACGLSADPPAVVRAAAPWRDFAYDVAVDTRVDTTFQRRAGHFTTTAATIEKLHAAARGPVAVFFPSYAYAEAIRRALENDGAPLRVAVQPRLPDLAAQTAWVEESLVLADVLFLILGSSFTESIDLLGGRVAQAMVAGPALPEVNAVQRARLALAERAGLSREQAFRRVYQVAGMQKVNQALGRLVRAPGQRARVLLHCRRFAEPGYAALLAPEYQRGEPVADEAGLAAWLG